MGLCRCIPTKHIYTAVPDIPRPIFYILQNYDVRAISTTAGAAAAAARQQQAALLA